MSRHAHILGLLSVAIASFGVAAGSALKTTLVFAGLLAAAAVATTLYERHQARRPAPAEGAAPRDSLLNTKRVLMLMLAVGIVAYVGGGSTFSTFSAETSNVGSSAASGTLTMSNVVNSSATTCRSETATSADNYQTGCEIPITVNNQAPGVAGASAKITIANTGSLDASQLSVYAPYANATLATQVSSGSTISSITTTAFEGNIGSGDTIELDYNGQSIQMVASGAVSPTKTTIGIANPGSMSGTLTNNSTTVTLASTSALRAGMTVTGTGIPASTTIAQVSNATTIVLSNNATVTGSQSLTFSVKATIDYKVGTRVYDTSSNAGPTGTDCFDQITQSSPVGGATFGANLNFNGTDIGDGSHWDSTNSFCRTLLFWIQEQSQPVPTQSGTLNGTTTVTGLTTTNLAQGMTVTGTNIPPNTTIASPPGPSSIVLSNAATGSGSSTLTFTTNYCWWGLGSSSSANTSLATSNGMCFAPFSAAFSGSTTVSNATTSLTFASALPGNIKSGDVITISEPKKMVVRCTATQDAYIGATTVTVAASPSANACTSSASAWVPATGETFDSSATIVDTTINNGLNSDTTDTISNFDTSKGYTNKLELPALTSNGAHVPSGGGYSSVELARHGTTGDTRVFYIGAYFPAGSGTAQNATQGLMSTFGLSWRIQQG